MSRYNLRPRRSGHLPGHRPSGGDGPSEPNNDRRATLPMRLSLRRESMQAQAGSRRNSQLSARSTRTSGSSSANSRSSRGQTSSNPAASTVSAEADSTQSPENVPPPQEQGPPEATTAPNTSNPSKVQKKSRWTTEMNKFLLKTFLELSGKHDKTSAYSKELRDRFVAKFPQMEHVTVEMVMRQKGKICNKNVLTREDIEDVQKEIQGEEGPSVSVQEQPGPAIVTKQEIIDEPMCDKDNNNPESNRNSDTQLEYNFSNINNPDNDNEDLPKLAQENQFTLKQEIPKHREIE